MDKPSRTEAWGCVPPMGTERLDKQLAPSSHQAKELVPFRFHQSFFLVNSWFHKIPDEEQTRPEIRSF